MWKRRVDGQQESESLSSCPNLVSIVPKAHQLWMEVSGVKVLCVSHSRLAAGHPLW